MIKGIYSAFSALQSAWKYQDVVANNISNVNTIGFKRETAIHESFSDVLLTHTSQAPAPLPVRIQDVVGQIGTGMFVAGFATDFATGELQLTGNKLDLGLEEGFFAVKSADGQVFYTRDGRFNRDANGDLITSQGDHVLDASGNNINISSEDVKVTGDGTISIDGQDIAQLMVVKFQPGELSRAGEAYFTSAATGTQVNGLLHQGFLEGSNTSLTEELTSMLAAQRTFQANQTILAKLDETLGEAAGSVGQFGGQ